MTIFQRATDCDLLITVRIVFFIFCDIQRNITMNIVIQVYQALIN